MQFRGALLLKQLAVYHPESDARVKPNDDIRHTQRHVKQ